MGSTTGGAGMGRMRAPSAGACKTGCANLTSTGLERPNVVVQTFSQPRRAAGFSTFSVIASLALAAPSALAASNDIHLQGLIDDGKVDNEGFRALVRELGLVMTPSSLQPAETTGQSGFDFGLDYTFHTMNFDEPYWTDARENSSVPLLMSLGARARKGFVLPVPLTSEIEIGAQWLLDSRLLTMGTNIRVALNEGFRWVPDLAVQAGINRMVGDNDLDLLTVTAGGQISKGFGILGSFNLCPYVGYQSIWVNGSSRIIDTGPADPANVNDNVVFEPVPMIEFDPNGKLVNIDANRLDRVSIGVRWIIAVVQVAAGVDMNMVSPVAGSNAKGEAEMLLQYGLRAGIAL